MLLTEQPQGLSSRQCIQRQSTTVDSGTHTGTPSAPAKCAVAVSAVMTRSRVFMMLPCR
jgi:hypothetical protein